MPHKLKREQANALGPLTICDCIGIGRPPRIRFGGPIGPRFSRSPKGSPQPYEQSAGLRSVDAKRHEPERCDLSPPFLARRAKCRAVGCVDVLLLVTALVVSKYL